jgi:hypothetical protein
MSSSTKRIFFGAGLILVGGLFLAQQLLGLEIHLGAVIIGVLFALGAAAFLFVMFQRRENWWAAIPGITLLGLAVLICFGSLFPEFFDRFGGSIFLGSIGLAFLIVLLMKHENWWAVIPMGVLFTLALVAGVGDSLGGWAVSAILFLGIAITFGVIGLMPVGRNEKWPWIPAGVCGVIGTCFMLFSSQMMASFAGLIWPAILVIFGVYLIARTFLKK